MECQAFSPVVWIGSPRPLTRKRVFPPLWFWGGGINVLDSETRIREVFKCQSLEKNEDLCSSRPECQSSSLKVVLGGGGGDYPGWVYRATAHRYTPKCMKSGAVFNLYYILTERKFLLDILPFPWAIEYCSQRETKRSVKHVVFILSIFKRCQVYVDCSVNCSFILSHIYRHTYSVDTHPSVPPFHLPSADTQTGAR